MSWVERKLIQLDNKGKENWDMEDWEDFHYCQECLAEDERDREYLDNFSLIV